MAEALARVKLSQAEIGERSPLELSGGQMRRVAIAGVLAMRPGTLVLDEPAAGLDPAGRRDMLDLVSALHKDGTTIVMVSHSMEDVANYATRIAVLEHGALALLGEPQEVFAHGERLAKIGLDVPVAVRIAETPRAKGYVLPKAYAGWTSCAAGCSNVWRGDGPEMMKNITLGQFMPGDSVVHRLDPRCKLGLTLAYIVGVFLVKGAAGYAVTALLVALVARWARIPLKYSCCAG